MVRTLFYIMLSLITTLQVVAHSNDTAPNINVAQMDAQRDSVLQLITGAKKPIITRTITSFGARGDGRTDAAPAFRKAMTWARKKGGLHLVVTPGVYLLKGPIRLESNVCIDLADGATLKFDAMPQYYLPMVKTSWEGTYLNNYSPMIYGYGVNDVSIVGQGTIDGNCAETFSTWKPKQAEAQKLSRDMNHREVPIDERNFGEGNWLRPQFIQLFNCNNVTLENFFVTRSPFWCIHLLKCENIICRGLRYDAKLVNNDGIDPESSRNILIEDICFDNGDDNIAIKSGRDNDGWNLGGPTENIIIRRCHFKGLHAVVIGSEMSGGVSNVWVEDCDYAGYCKRGIFVKTNPNRGGYVRNVFVRNCVFDEVEDLFYITSAYHGEGMDDIHFSDIENIHVDGLKANRCKEGALILQGTEQKHIRNISFRNVEVKEMKNAISFEFADDVSMSDCFLGGKVDVPTHVK